MKPPNRLRKRSNETHASATDPDARLAWKSNGQASKLCYAGHVVMENRHGLATRATGIAERYAGEAMMARLDRAVRSTLGADKNYDTQGFFAAMHRFSVTPHVAQHKPRVSAARWLYGQLPAQDL